MVQKAEPTGEDPFFKEKGTLVIRGVNKKNGWTLLVFVLRHIFGLFVPLRSASCIVRVRVLREILTGSRRVRIYIYPYL